MIVEPLIHGFTSGIPAEDVDALKSRIAELERELADAKAGLLKKSGEYFIVNRETMNAKDDRIKYLQSELYKAASLKTKENRLFCEEGKYDKTSVDGIQMNGAESAAALAEDVLGTGGKISYAAACMLIFKRELDKPKPKVYFSEYLALRSSVRSAVDRIEAATNTLFATVCHPIPNESAK